MGNGKIFPHLDHGKPLRPRPTPQVSLAPEVPVPQPPPLPFRAVVYGRWQTWLERLLAFRRLAHAKLITWKLIAELSVRKFKELSIAKTISFAATLFSVVV